MIKFNFEKEQAEYLDAALGRLPKHWRNDAIKKHRELAKREGLANANEWLRVLIEPLKNLLDIAADDGDLKSLADDMTARCREAQSKGMYDRAYMLDYYKEACAAYAIRYPAEYDALGVSARLCDAWWWLRNLRVSHARAREVAAIQAGIVNRKKCLYVSDDTLDRRQQQKRRNAETLEGVTMESESGEKMTLAEIASTGQANAENRRAELMTRISGFEQLATKHKHKAEFITVTCPSRMHAVTSNGANNPKYDKTTPAMAQSYLVEQWALVRKKLHREGVRAYGLRVAEPHHDGTPHWHLCLFYDGEVKTLQAIRAAFIEHFCGDSIDELEAIAKRQGFASFEHKCKAVINRKNCDLTRLVFKVIDGRGACGYVAKYVSKNIGGIENEASDESKDATSESAAARVEAWASTWRIRQFQQIGGHAVTVWRELRRVKGESIPHALNDLLKAWRAAQKTKDKLANFADYIEAQGGLNTPMRDSRLKLDDDYIMQQGRYGETAARIIKGVRERWGLGRVPNDREKWSRVKNEQRQETKTQEALRVAIEKNDLKGAFA